MIEDITVKNVAFSLIGIWAFVSYQKFAKGVVLEDENQ
jgi:hypothetical protein